MDGFPSITFLHWFERTNMLRCKLNIAVIDHIWNIKTLVRTTGHNRLKTNVSSNVVLNSCCRLQRRRFQVKTKGLRLSGIFSMWKRWWQEELSMAMQLIIKLIKNEEKLKLKKLKQCFRPTVISQINRGSGSIAIPEPTTRGQ